jgi:hypothetical protein
MNGELKDPKGGKDPRAGLLPAMVKVQYRLGKESRIMSLWMPLESEVRQVRIELQKRHPDRLIEKLYQKGGELADEDPIIDWRTATGTRFQVTISIDNELREDEGKESDSGPSLQLEPEESSSDEQTSPPEDSEEKRGAEEEDDEDGEPLDESFKFAPYSGLNIIEDSPAILSALLTEETPTPKEPEKSKIMILFDRWRRLELTRSENWREQVAAYFELTSDAWKLEAWEPGEFELAISQTRTRKEGEDQTEEKESEKDKRSSRRKS